MGWVVKATPRSLYPEERDPVVILQEAGWALEPIWTDVEVSFPPGFDPRTVQPSMQFVTGVLIFFSDVNYRTRFMCTLWQ